MMSGYAVGDLVAEFLSHCGVATAFGIGAAAAAANGRKTGVMTADG